MLQTRGFFFNDERKLRKAFKNSGIALLLAGDYHVDNDVLAVAEQLGGSKKYHWLDVGHLGGSYVIAVSPKAQLPKALLAELRKLDHPELY